MQAISIR
ncbi:Protein of unknown function [Bacillus cytotoxicus]|nr:Protein of unknown function [Bacillus cytotoxicus]SCN36406.1 Protein of unknown function [Bacillus cytotoxicus]